MIFACTSCKTRFEGASYRDVSCPACGALAQQAVERPCPRCELPLTSREVSDLVIDECTGCQGVFLDEHAIRRLLDDEHRAEALMTALPRAARPFAGGRMYIKCPTCSTMMNRKLFATGSGVVVDVCKPHGTFFDAGELTTIIEFVRRGGLEAAAKKDAQRKAERDKHDKAHAAEVHAMPATTNERGSAFVELLLSLFR
jgi:Zn-finger nucleic acid-binding protein